MRESGPVAEIGRHRAREMALKVLYQHELAGGDPETAFRYLCQEEGVEPEAAGFAWELVEGVLRGRAELDGYIARYSRGWPLDRIAPVERNVLRIGLHELLHRPDIPPGVAVAEAVELAKTYGGEDSGRFVNGILGQVLRDLEEKA